MRIFDKLVVAGLVAAISLAASTAPAQKGGGGGGSTTPPPTPGKIYYSSAANGTSHQYTMNGDGSAKTLLFSTAWPYSHGAWSGHPSYGTPGGRRWFVSVRTHSTETTWTQFAVFTSDSGEEREFQLEPTIPQYNYNGYMGPAWIFGEARWMPGDSRISILTTYHDENGEIDHRAVYTLQVIQDSTGNPAGLAPKVFGLAVTGGDPSYVDNGINSYDWNPDGTAVVFVRGFSHLHISDATGIRHLYTTTNGSGIRMASWAPGSKNQIAFSQHNELRVINLDGSGVKVIATATGKNTSTASYFIDRINWSPDTHVLVFDERSATRKNFSSPWQYTYQIMRVPSAGGTKTKIADGLNFGWR
jgi:hypothetical protein